MKCYYCKKTLKPKDVTYTINRKGYDVIVRDVPAFVCQECGETFFGEESVKAIQSLIGDVDKKVEKIKQSHFSPNLGI